MYKGYYFNNRDGDDNKNSIVFIRNRKNKEIISQMNVILLFNSKIKVDYSVLNSQQKIFNDKNID
jgi:hypothetical protein